VRLHVHGAVSRGRLVAVIGLALPAAIALTGCDGVDDSLPPTPKSSTRSSTPAPPTTPAPPGSSQSAAAPTGDLRPCELLDDAAMAALRVELQGSDDVGAARTCQWLRSGRYTVGVAIWDDLGIDQVRSETKVEHITIADRAAVRAVGVLDTCFVSLDVGRTARVDVLSSADGNLEIACPIASRAAEFVEARLP